MVVAGAEIYDPENEVAVVVVSFWNSRKKLKKQLRIITLKTISLKRQEHFYHDGHGFIQYRLKNIRTSRSDECRRKKKRCLPSMLSHAHSSTTTNGSHARVGNDEVDDEEPALTAL